MTYPIPAGFQLAVREHPKHSIPRTNAAPLRKARGMFNPEDPVRPGDLLSIEEDGTVTVTPSAGEQE